MFILFLKKTKQQQQQQQQNQTTQFPGCKTNSQTRQSV